MITRRRLLLGALGFVGIAGIGAWLVGPAAMESKIASIVRKRLDFLKLDEEGLQAYARDQTAKILAKRVSLNRMRYHLMSAVATSFTRYQRSTDKRSRIQRAEDGFVSTYLLSSDFFIGGSDESRTVRYLGYYDPLRPCNNPFARPAVDTPGRG
jgi:hypothetical protein